MNRDFVDFYARMNVFGVTSFSLASTTVLMWSHYAEQHKGLCIEYDSSNEQEVRRFEGISNCDATFNSSLNRFVFTKGLPPEAIRGIYFGLRFDPVLMDDLCRREHAINPDCRFLRAKRDTQKFEIAFDEYKLGSYA